MGHAQEASPLANFRRHVLNQALDIISAAIPDGKELGSLTQTEVVEVLKGRLDNIDTSIQALTLALQKSLPIYDRFVIPIGAPITHVLLRYPVSLTLPFSLLFNGLHQKTGFDYLISNNKVDWINTVETWEPDDIIEVVYYRS